MATAYAPESVRKVRAISVTPETEGISRELWLLIIGGIAGAVLWVIAGLNYLGTMTILFAPGESAGANPAGRESAGP